MGQLSTTSPRRRRKPQPWPRSIRRGWVRPDDLASVTRLFAAVPSLPRAELARLTDRMIDRMDEIDGDPDREGTFEDDEPEQDVDDAHDDGCGPVHKHGLTFWGSREDDLGVATPTYGLDQTFGPINL